MQYYLQNNNSGQYDINVLPAWEITTGNSNITVAVIDEGVDSDHEDLSGNVLQGYTIGDATGYGKPKNANEFNYKGHGVACAGIIGAKNNPKGILGAAYGVNILPVNIVPYTPYEYYVNGVKYVYSGFTTSNTDLADAIQWAADRADILSCSWGSDSETYAVKTAINNAMTNGRNGKGCIVVASSGNEYPYKTTIKFPAQMDGVIAVGAIDRYGNIQPYSQRGSALDLVAPSGLCDLQGDVVTTDRMGSLGYNPHAVGSGVDLADENYTQKFGGTSAACPQVAGVAALMLSANPNLTMQQIRTILHNTATDLGSTGFDTTYGYGLVDAFEAVKAAYSYNLSISGSSSPCGSEVYSIANLPDSLTVTWSWHPILVRSSDSEGTDDTDSFQPDSSQVMFPPFPPYINDVWLRPNIPATNQCTMVITSGTYIEGTLKATIMKNGTTICVLEKYLDSSLGFYGTYTRYQVGSGTIGPNQFSSGSTMVANYGDVVTLQSPYFIDANISKYSTIPLNWTNNNGTISFVIPMSSQGNGAATISFSGTNADYCMSFSFTINVNAAGQMLAPAPAYDLLITPEGQSYVFSIVSSDENKDKENENLPYWTLTIVNTITGQIVYNGEVNSSALSVSSEGWKEGVYAAKAVIGNDVITKKVSCSRR